MSDPLALLPLALAAKSGRVNEYDVSQLIAAGLTLLQRSAPLVRALAGRRSAILLPNSTAFFTALAASDGRGALLLSPELPREEITRQLVGASVGAVFTTAEYGRLIPADCTVALLDDAPRTATVIAPSRTMTVDLGSHHGLSLEGDGSAEGRDEECVAAFGGDEGVELRTHTHRELLSDARASVAQMLLTPVDHTLAAFPFTMADAFVRGALAPLLAGGHVTTLHRPDAATVLSALATDGVTTLVADAALYGGVLDTLVERGEPWNAPSLASCIGMNAQADEALGERWLAATGTRITWSGTAAFPR